MDYTEAKIGRIFILRLHQNECLHEVIEAFAVKKQIKNAMCFFLGGVADKSKVVVGPEDGKIMPPNPMITLLQGVYEGCGLGTIFVDETDTPKLHMHASFGRKNNAVAGCVRMGVNIWLIGEVVILEMTGGSAKRVKNKETGFELLETQ